MLIILRDETMLQKSFGECYMTENIILAVGFSLLALMIIGTMQHTVNLLKFMFHFGAF
jgi:hypothetical protein